ncbi:MAG: hypothetical protein WDO69_32650 [Pseudomonadota bacterium]
MICEIAWTTVQLMELGAWTTTAVRHIRQELRADPSWTELLTATPSSRSVHLAVFVEPFLSYVLDGVKTIESRFSKNQCAPFKRIQAGDIVLLKAASGPVRGICQVAKTWFFDLRSVPLLSVRERFGEAICATDDEFWDARVNAEYATLLKLQRIRALEPLVCPKRDRRGWVVLRGQTSPIPMAYSS